MIAKPSPPAAHYEGLFHHAPAHGIALLDDAGIVVDWNAAAEAVTGVPRDAATGRDHAWLLALLGVGGDPDAALRRAREGAVLTESAWVAPDGRRPRWCESRLSAIRGEDGSVTGFAVIVSDATEALRRELAHPESESRFARALEHAPVFVFNQDRDLRYVWAPMAMPGLGVRAGADAVGRSDADLLPAPAAEALARIKGQVIERAAGERHEVEVDSPAGTFVFDLTVEPLHGPDGEVCGITCAAIDITERRRIEDELRRSRALLAEAEHLARFGSWEWDVERDRIHWSDGLYEIYGLTPETLDARWAAREAREQRIHPEDRARVETAVARALDDAGAIDIEYRLVRPDGRVRRVHGRAEVMVAGDGRPVRMAGTVQDVTEIRAAEEALERTAAELGRRAAELHQVTRHPAGGTAGVEHLLTGRQLEVLALIADGYGNAQIAARLYLSETTVKWHVRQILRKLGVSNRAEAVARYVRTAGPED